MDIYTRNNIRRVREAIALKTDYEGKNLPFYGTVEGLLPVMTDQDHFPYTRYFRGQYERDVPVIFEREAGWRPLNNACYKDLVVPNIKPVEFCWQAPCHTVLPCENKTKSKYNCEHPGYTQQP